MRRAALRPPRALPGPSPWGRARRNAASAASVRLGLFPPASRSLAAPSVMAPSHANLIPCQPHPVPASSHPSIILPSPVLPWPHPSRSHPIPTSSHPIPPQPHRIPASSHPSARAVSSCIPQLTSSVHHGPIPSQPHPIPTSSYPAPSYLGTIHQGPIPSQPHPIPTSSHSNFVLLQPRPGLAPSHPSPIHHGPIPSQPHPTLAPSHTSPPSSLSRANRVADPRAKPTGVDTSSPALLLPALPHPGSTLGTGSEPATSVPGRAASLRHGTATQLRSCAGTRLQHPASPRPGSARGMLCLGSPRNTGPPGFGWGVGGRADSSVGSVRAAAVKEFILLLLLLLLRATLRNACRFGPQSQAGPTLSKGLSAAKSRLCSRGVRPERGEVPAPRELILCCSIPAWGRGWDRIPAGCAQPRRRLCLSFPKVCSLQSFGTMLPGLAWHGEPSAGKTCFPLKFLPFPSTARQWAFRGSASAGQGARASSHCPPRP